MMITPQEFLQLRPVEINLLVAALLLGHNGSGFSFDSCIGDSTKDCPSWTNQSRSNVTSPTSDSANAYVGTSPDDFSDVKAHSPASVCKLEIFPSKMLHFGLRSCKAGIIWQSLHIYIIMQSLYFPSHLLGSIDPPTPPILLWSQGMIKLHLQVGGWEKGCTSASGTGMSLGCPAASLGSMDSLPGWWFQPLWKNISQIGSLPQVGVKKAYLKPPPRLQ